MAFNQIIPEYEGLFKYHSDSKAQTIVPQTLQPIQIDPVSNGAQMINGHWYAGHVEGLVSFDKKK